MDHPATVVLPEGFLTNTKEIYQEVASYPVIPPEQLFQYWHGKHTNMTQHWCSERLGANYCFQYTPPPSGSSSIPQLTASKTSGGMLWGAIDAT
jgi:hypothetical protein